MQGNIDPFLEIFLKNNLKNVAPEPNGFMAVEHDSVCVHMTVEHLIDFLRDRMDIDCEHDDSDINMLLAEKLAISHDLTALSDDDVSLTHQALAAGLHFRKLIEILAAQINAENGYNEVEPEPQPHPVKRSKKSAAAKVLAVLQ